MIRSCSLAVVTLSERATMDFSQVLFAYLITFGWAIVGSIGVAVGISLSIKIFDWTTPSVNEWELVKNGNIPIAIILSSMIIAVGLVIASAIRP